MEPNILDGEHVFVSYNEKLDVGKVVILEVTEYDNVNITESSFYIKRIIGKPGDQIRWNGNKLFVNDQEYKEEYFEDGHFGSSTVNQFDGIFTYKKNGETFTTETIPEGYYFVMGDNRGDSKDSRDIGLIPEKNIIGVAKYHMSFIIPRGKIR